jgi:diaminopimelate decarboxylase
MTVLAPMEALKFLTPDEVPVIAQRFGTPAFVYDEARMRATVEYLRALPSAFGHTIRYSIKANPSAAVIRLFDSMGTHFDASSVYEVQRAVRAGVDPAKILLTAQEAVFDRTLLDLVNAGLHFDAGSLHQLAEFGKARPGSAVSVRINPGFGSGLVPRLTSGGPKSSFGIWHEYVPEIKPLLEQYDLRLERLHTHIGSGHYADVLVPAARKLLALVGEFPDVQCVNLGGGYRITVLAGDPEYDHAEWAAILAEEIRQLSEVTGRRLHLELEPGTFLVANAGSIVTTVIDVVDTGAAGNRFVKIDAGLTELLRPSYYGSPHPVVGVGRDGTLPAEGAPSSVAGHCCIAGDMVTLVPDNEHQPVRLADVRPGDHLVIERAGGYCTSMTMRNFNSYPDAPEVLRRLGGGYDLIRARQTVDQLVANERIPADLA